MLDKKNILQKIIENKKEELENKKSNSKKFKEIFAEKNANLIAEIKLASPKFDYSKEINLEKLFEFY
jgi:indole-3-glycerol phosphate synthase